MSTYQKILIAIDVNAQYDKVIQKAMTICQSNDALNLLYVPLPMTYINPYLYGIDYGDINDINRSQKAREKLQDIAEKYAIPDKNIHIKVGDAGDEIKDMANQLEADLIVIGTHGRSGIKLLLGSTATAVLHGVKQDVLAVRIHDED